MYASPSCPLRVISCSGRNPPSRAHSEKRALFCEHHEPSRAMCADESSRSRRAVRTPRLAFMCPAARAAPKPCTSTRPHHSLNAPRRFVCGACDHVIHVTLLRFHRRCSSAAHDVLAARQPGDATEPRHITHALLTCARACTLAQRSCKEERRSRIRTRPAGAHRTM